MLLRFCVDEILGAAERGHYALLEKLIQIGRPSPGGNMLMHLAARYGHVSVIR